jgi:23S rRNA (cytosine1962-C5)-methyltransferase
VPATPELVIKPDRARSLERRHPWIFSGAVHGLNGAAGQGDTVRVVRRDGGFLAWAAYNASSQIVARVWSFAEDAVIDDAFFARRVEAAVAARRAVLDAADLAACRLVHAESDGLPGLVADRYGELVVMQATSAGATLHRDVIARALAAATGVSQVYERSEGEVLALEGLQPRQGALCGASPPGPIEVAERGMRYAVDVGAGQKTGFYLDQRDNRALLRRLARDKRVLDCFCYTGGFALNAALGGARSVTALDSSEEALVAARRNATLNGLPDTAIAFERADVFEWLRRARDSRQRFELIVLDPPKLAPSARHVERAARAYKDLNLLAFKLLEPGGQLLTFSCSSAMQADLFQKVVASAASDARVDASFLGRLGPGGDHPVGVHFPEGEYLKGLWCRVAGGG